ncbi:UNKNOWN [Stylonychia lemnae]|uniref:Uncharacterized protein n=1 Tax=Stylonychia lemnae TaxID=5949 RepID=A0A078ANY1_STYLE|nr:UNKNOWN [Stylonychia lemnae]|eukprot:CDW83636.1 UNKNOWN [Stylonychia lemnae]
MEVKTFQQVPLNINKNFEEEDARIEGLRKQLLLQNNKSYGNPSRIDTKLAQNFKQSSMNSEINESQGVSKTLTVNNNQIQMRYNVNKLHGGNQIQSQQYKVNQIRPEDKLKVGGVTQTSPTLLNGKISMGENYQKGDNLVKALQSVSIQSPIDQGLMGINLGNMQLKQGVRLGENTTHGLRVIGQGGEQGTNQQSIRYSRKEYLQNFANRNLTIVNRQQQNFSQPTNSSIVNQENINELSRRDMNNEYKTPIQASKEPPNFNNNMNQLIIQENQSDISQAYQTDYITKQSILSSSKIGSTRDKISMQANTKNPLSLLIVDQQERPFSNNSNGLWSPKTNYSQAQIVGIVPQVPQRNVSIHNKSRGQLLIGGQQQNQFDEMNKNLLRNNYQSFSSENNLHKKVFLNPIGRQNSQIKSKIIISDKNTVNNLSKKVR